MSENGISPPSRQMDEFEEMVFEYTRRMGLNNEEVGLSLPLKPTHTTCPAH